MRKQVAFLLAVLIALSGMMLTGSMAEPAQEIVFALQNEPYDLDPSVFGDIFAYPFLSNCFEGLVTYDTTNGSLIGGNAESWTISEDGTVYTFTLRDSLKWSDGSPLTSKDYLYAFKRMLNPATTAQYVNMLTDYIVGAQAFYDNTGSEEALGIKAPDDKTLVLTLKTAASYYIDILAIITFSPVQQATIETNGDKWTASPAAYACNGPFMVSEMNMGESVVLVKNPEYYDADKVALQKVTFRYIKDLSTALLAYESGEIDGSRSFPYSDYSRLKAEGAGVVSVSSYGTAYYDFNCLKAPFDNVLVRKAFCLAVDRTSLIDDVLQIPAEPAYSFIAPGYVVNGSDFAEGRSTFGLSPFADVEGACAALAEAGYPGGVGFPEITLSYYASNTIKKIAEALAEMLQANLQITIKIAAEEWSSYLTSIMAGNFDLCALGFNGDYLHPMTFLPLLKTGEVNSLGVYFNPAYDALVDRAQTETNPAKALTLMRKADNIASAEYPMLTLYYKANVMLMKPNVQGYYLNPSDMLFLKTAKVVE